MELDFVLFKVNPRVGLNPTLSAYLSSPFCQTVRRQEHNGHTYYSYELNDKLRSRTGGIHSSLKKKYYPDFEYKKNKGRKRLKKGSNKQEGINVGQQIEAYMVDRSKKPRHRFAKHVVHFIEQEKGHSLVATEVPVYVDALQCITQADIISQDNKGRLYVWELKCGQPNVGSQGFLRGGLDQIKSTRLNHWELQRHFTTLALEESGVKIHKSYILQVFDHYQREKKEKVVRVKARNPAAWTKKVAVGEKRKRE